MPDQYMALFSRINELQKTRARILLAVDGNSAAGKTTFAEDFGRRFDCNVFHMDDFFLRPTQKNAARLAQPGGNIDYERFYEEVLLPVKAGLPVAYRPYACKTQTFADSVRINPKPLNLIEGAYALHPELWDSYNLRVFLSASPEVQRARILKRNGMQNAAMFFEKWIPLENSYFDAYKIRERCDYCFSDI